MLLYMYRNFIKRLYWVKGTAGPQLYSHTCTCVHVHTYAWKERCKISSL